jgi:ABC-type branched-subunit amino acid transport system ATPase component
MDQLDAAVAGPKAANGRKAPGVRQSLAGASPAGGPDGLLLRTEGMTVTYDNGAAGVAGVSIEVPLGAVVAVLGRNGAGKTSFLRGVAGFLKSERVRVTGRVELNGTDIAGATPMATNKLGITFVPERAKVFPNVTVADHFRLVGVKNVSEVSSLGFEPLGSRWTTRAGLLSGGERQMLALAVAWVQRPKLLLVDELSLGLAPIITKQLLAAVRRMVVEGSVSAIVVEQDAVAALAVADHVYVIDHGEAVWSGQSSATSADALTETYLGGGR